MRYITVLFWYFFFFFTRYSREHLLFFVVLVRDCFLALSGTGFRENVHRWKVVRHSTPAAVFLCVITYVVVDTGKYFLRVDMLLLICAVHLVYFFHGLLVRCT